jgi:hypothetical protein
MSNRTSILERAVENASYALNPNQGERPDPTVASMWLRTTFPDDHPNYINPSHPYLKGTDYYGEHNS